MPYKVFVDDGYALMDESKRYPAGVFDSYKAAVAAAEAIVDEFLLSSYRPGMQPEELLAAYRGYGEDPFIVSTDPDGMDDPIFSARAYAAQSCAEICAGQRPWWKFWDR
ncbi:hypothetical protein [Delftia tsuruhatensis]|uniref:hypothetical protein n=1 Tax=Delftia tsuruhatensis TaxID=180282 RepID=UPI001F333472|nr:hypothetical protein [Delftia tsuruhatensis]